VLTKDDRDYLVDLWFYMGQPQRFAQRHPGYRVVYSVRSSELGPMADQSEQAIRDHAQRAEDKAIMQLGRLNANDPKSVSAWIQKNMHEMLPDYDPDKFMNMPVLDWDQAIWVSRDTLRFPKKLREPRLNQVRLAEWYGLAVNA
jgi:hypothetical protein